MGRKKLEISLSPIAVQVDKAAKKLKALKPKVSASDRKAIDKELKDLTSIRAIVVKLCGGRMTRAFLPESPEE
jgi:hypothetical protein